MISELVIIAKIMKFMVQLIQNVGNQITEIYSTTEKKSNQDSFYQAQATTSNAFSE
jgi:hypothetical protein